MGNKQASPVGVAANYGAQGPSPITAAEAVRAVESGHRVFVHGASAFPQRLVDALTDRGRVAAGMPLKNVEILHLHTNGLTPYVAQEFAGAFHHRALFVGGNVREAVDAGRATYVPIFMSDIPEAFRRGHLHIDVVLLHLSMPDEHGYCSFGTSVDCALAATEVATIRIAQINPNMPRTHGDSFIHVSRLTHIVEVDDPLPEIQAHPVDEIQELIAKNVAEIISDGATLQLGIGGIPDAALRALRERRDLGIHSEVISDGIVDLVERGVVTGARKTVDPGKIVASFLNGTRRLYDFVADNPMVEMRPVDYTNDARIIREQDNMVAVNSAVEIDLTGQVCAESIGSKIYSGVGGQMDFLRGAALSRGGKPVIALPSTARGGTVSRIAAVLQPGAGVTTTRAHVHFVATEYGIVNLHGLDLEERARALIDLAHPAFRDELTRSAYDLHLIGGRPGRGGEIGLSPR